MSEKRGPVIAIDGPAGTGKSSVTKQLAEALGFLHIDTGALYRAIAFLTLETIAKDHSQLTTTLENTVAPQLARSTHLAFHRMPDKNPHHRIFANGRDLTDLIRSPAVSQAASRVSAIPEVRSALLGLQRHLGIQGKTILEGRDIGTIVFPDADFKFFLSASIDERAKRRLNELKATGIDPLPSFEELKAQILERDQGDITRAIAPLKKAPDAIELDTSTMTLDEVVTWITHQVQTRFQHPH